MYEGGGGGGGEGGVQAKAGREREKYFSGFMINMETLSLYTGTRSGGGEEEGGGHIRTAEEREVGECTRRGQVQQGGGQKGRLIKGGGGELGEGGRGQNIIEQPVDKCAM